METQRPVLTAKKVKKRETQNFSYLRGKAIKTGASYLAKHSTRLRCDRHGWVIGRFGEASSEGMCKTMKYYVNYCCGLRCTNEKPKSLYDEIMEEAQSSASDAIQDL